MISGVKCLLRQAMFGSISGLIFMRIRCSFWPSIASYHCWILFISIPRWGYNYTWFSAENLCHVSVDLKLFKLTFCKPAREEWCWQRMTKPTIYQLFRQGFGEFHCGEATENWAETLKHTIFDGWWYLMIHIQIAVFGVYNIFHFQTGEFTLVPTWRKQWYLQVKNGPSEGPSTKIICW